MTGRSTRPGVSEAARRNFLRKGIQAVPLDLADWQDRRETYHSRLGEDQRSAALELLRRATKVEALATPGSPAREIFEAECLRLRNLARQIGGADHV